MNPKRPVNIFHTVPPIQINPRGLSAQIFQTFLIGDFNTNEFEVYPYHVFFNSVTSLEIQFKLIRISLSTIFQSVPPL